MKVLVVEDERKVRRFIQQGLEQAGMVVDAVESIPELMTALKTTPYDILVLDRLLQDVDSLDSLAAIHEASPRTKILILSALSEVEDKVKGLSIGADDYLGKPFHVTELIARIRSLTRRASASSETSDTIVTYQDLKIDLQTQKVYRGEQRIELTGKEFRTLSLLARNPGHIYSKAALLDQVWDMNHFPESNVVEVTIANLRSKVDKGFTPLIQSRRGVGYWLGEP